MPINRDIKGHARKTAAKVRHKYYRYMPEKKHHRVLIWVVFFAIAFILGAQMLYPLDKAPPFASIRSQNVAFQDRTKLSERLTSEFRNTKVTLDVGSKNQKSFDLVAAGADQDIEKLTFRLTDYPFWQRLIPGSLFWQTPNITTVKPVFSSAILDDFSAKRAAEVASKPENARLIIENGELKSFDEIPGIVVKKSDITNTLQQANFTIGADNKVKVTAKKIQPEITAADFDVVRQKTQAALAHHVIIIADNKQFTPDHKEIAKWLSIGLDSGKATFAIDKNAVLTYIASINKEVGIEPQSTRISVVDGVMASRQEGTSGRTVNAELLFSQLNEALLSEQQDVELKADFVPVAPPTVYNTTYTSSEVGLRAYVADESRNNTHIVVRQLRSGGWTASARADESIPSGSTYKLYVALWLFDQMDKGLIHWEDPWLDTTVSVCFDRMTIASTNPCANAWIDKAGRDNLNNFVYAHGFSQGTSFTMPDANHTTANDLAKYMTGLNDGSLVGGAHRDRLLHSLSVHPYRYGVPTGSAGFVQDKVGFLWDYVHDAAIVHHPRGDYIIVVMTKGRSYAAIAEITRQVERIMYP